MDASGLSPPPGGFCSRSADELAPLLLGCLLRTHLPDGVASGVIVEVEAYTGDDPASHSHPGPSARNAPMFGPGGRAYVYLSYGMHRCFNVTAGAEGSGEAVLVRALEPLEGIGLMMRRRGTVDPRLLASGPGRLALALGIELSHSGTSLLDGPVRLLVPAAPSALRVAAGPRVGISRARERQWRFWVEGSPWVSRGGRAPRTS
jgi:DNA-3-methyladenine glycosylase